MVCSLKKNQEQSIYALFVEREAGEIGLTKRSRMANNAKGINGLLLIFFPS
jgi:hypothetical protein